MRKFIKSILIAVVLLVSQVNAFAAWDDDVAWSYKVNHIEGNLYEVEFAASVKAGYYMYDLGPYEDKYGPNVTVFTFEPSENVKLEGQPYHITQPKKEFDKMFGYAVGHFEGVAKFGQKVRLYGKEAALAGSVEWSVCVGNACKSAVDTDFNVKVKASADKFVVAAGTATPAAQDAVSETKAVETNKSLWNLILLAIGGALMAIVTPCVFPMIPMTVSFFLKGSENKARGRFRAGMYGLFIVALYTIPIAALIIVTRFVGGDAVTADIFNWIATHWLPNILFFVVFMVFAASFLGAFEITLPSRFVNSADKNADKKGLGGVFFMALTLVLVSFSCTGPIVSSVIIDSLAGGVWAPIITILIFSATFALPFVVFALFPSLLNKLPKSGGWLNSVKVVLGFVELALGLKFLSIADQVYHWGILDREIYLALWIVIFTLLGFYLLGKLKFKHDSDVKYVSVGRLTLAVIVFSFVVYMIPGMWGAPLKGLSGYLPPLTSQDFVLEKGGGATASHNTVMNVGGEKKKYSDFLEMPLGLDGFFTYEEGLAYARKVNKPLFVDFTGHACVNCREMEARVWSDPEVLKILREEFVIVALFADDKTILPEEDWVTMPNGKVLKGLGKINSYFVSQRYKANSQPAYIILDHNENMLMPVRSYNLSVPDYIKFLNDGIANFKKSQK